MARIVHHAAQAGDAAAIVAYGPGAAREAARAGAHREAAAHYHLVLEHAGRFAPRERARLLEEYGVECYTLGSADTAVGAQRRAVELNRTLGDPGRLGGSLRWLSRMYWWAGQRAAAEQAGLEAVAVLEQADDRRLLALALSNQSQLGMLAHRPAEAIGYGQRAAALAREAGDAAIISHALANIGSCQWFLGDPAGEETLAEALQVALDAGDTEDACRAYVNLTWNLLDRFRLDEAERYLAAAMRLAEEDEFLGFLSYMQVAEARLALGRGQWERAVQLAGLGAEAVAPTRCAALTVLACVGVRRGEPDAGKLLGAAWELAVQIGEMQRMGPAAAARAEDAWLRGDLAAARDLVTPVHAEAARLGDAVHQSELGYWLAVAGARPPEDEPVAAGPAASPGPGAGRGSEHPYALLAAGRWREAASAWATAGCRYEQAMALAASPGPADLLAALALLDDLGAKPLATRVRGRLRALGVTRVPRGPLGGTRANAAGLTTRQVDVLRLLVQGHTNAQIAQQLVLSVRTVDSHVAAVLGKLGARDRHDAATRAAELGVLADQ